MAGHAASGQDRSDEELAEAFRGGDRGAFDLLVRRYKDQLLNFAYRFLGNSDDADDVVQETIIRFYRNPAAYRPIARFSTWLYTIAGNCAKSRLRQRKRHLFFSISRRTGSERGESYDLPDSAPGADRQTDSALREEAVQNALDRLPAKYREIVVLCDIQELTYEEITGITGLNMGTVKSRLNRARRKLQEMLKEYCDED
jgi:RNA polymerase sigma-70 factor, ECF subfamily